MRMTQKAVVYIGEFDLRNENVQAHLVRNNGKILKKLGYSVFFVGTNRKCSSFDDVGKLQPVKIEDGGYLELPHTLTTKGLFLYSQVKRKILSYLNELTSKYELEYIITYQAPTYAFILKSLALWCKERNIPYVVNCADLPVFESQPLIKRLVMGYNWQKMHMINKRYANGVVSVSRYIDNFYKKKNRPSVIIPPLFDEPGLADVKIEENNTPVFLYAGTPFISSAKKIKTKGMKDRLDKIIDLMLEIEKRNVEFQFDIVGISKKEYCACVPRHAEALKNVHKIVFWGKQSHDYTLKKLLSVDYMINYRDKNLMTEAGLSTKVVESISVGTPVIMNDIGDTFLYLNEGVSGIKLTGNLQNDVDVLSNLCEKSKEKRFENKIASKMSKTFSLEKYMPVMQQFLESVSKYVKL